LMGNTADQCTSRGACELFTGSWSAVLPPRDNFCFESCQPPFPPLAPAPGHFIFAGAAAPTNLPLQLLRFALTY
jgi:hypothetical protein